MAVGEYNTTLYKKATFLRSWVLYSDAAGTILLPVVGYHAHVVGVEEVVRNGDLTTVVVFNKRTEIPSAGITFNTVTSTITFELTPSETDAITDDKIKISVEIVDTTGRVIPVLEGKWRIKERPASLV